MSLDLNAQQYAHMMDFSYSDALSIAMTSPPSEHGVYGVMCFDGTTGVATWDGEKWIGMEGVARYSGRPLLLTRERRAQHIQTILTGINSPVQSVQRAVARESAVTLARHYASKMEKNRAGHRVNEYILKMWNLYQIAVYLGAKFKPGGDLISVSLTDQKLLAWADDHIAQSERKHFVDMMSKASRRTQAMSAWLNDLQA